MRRIVMISLALLISVSAYALPTEGVTVINSRDYYPAVQALLQSAESTVSLAMHQTRFYEEYEGSHSNNLCDALCADADRGVKVTFLIDQSADDWNNGNEQHADFGNRLAEHGATVYHDDLNRVTHTKLIIVDGIATVIASVNWSHYSLTSNHEVGVIVWGREFAEAAHAIMQEHCDAGTLKNGEGLPAFSAVEDDIAAYAAERGLEVIPVPEATLLFNEEYYPAVAEAIANAQRSVDSVQASAIYYRTRPGHAGPVAAGQTSVSRTNDLIDAMVAAKDRGVHAALTVEGWSSYGDGSPLDNRNLDIGFRANAAGLDIFWDPEDGQTHAKMVLVDDTVIVGSTNWTVFAVEGVNNELSVMFESPAVADIYRAYIEDLQTRGEKFTGEF